MASFGEYITSQYGILKDIFSHLSSKDLINSAAPVCRVWSKLAHRMIEANNRICSYYRLLSDDLPTFDDKLHPQVIIHFSSKAVINSRTGAIKLMKEMYAIEPQNVISVAGLFIRGKHDNHELRVNLIDTDYIHDTIKKELYLLLPQLEGVDMSILHINPWGNMDQCVREKIKPDTVCCVLFCGPSDARRSAAFMKAVDRWCKNVSLVGGICKDVLPFGQNKVTKMFGLCISGKNVQAVSGVHSLDENTDDINEWMEKFAEGVGPQPDNSYRLGFMFMCLDRISFYDTSEVIVFKKYFPNVPVYGYWSFGEFCIPTYHPHQHPQAKKMKIPDKEYNYARCTSIAIITFLKDTNPTVD